MNKKTLKTALQYAFFAIVIIFLMLASFMAGYKRNVDNYEYYYDKTEILLDSISSWYGHKAFQDSIMNTQTYYEYELAKEHLSTK